MYDVSEETFAGCAASFVFGGRPMADEKSRPKPFASGILSQTTGRPGETVQQSYKNEVVKERSRTHAPVSSSRPASKPKG